MTAVDAQPAGAALLRRFNAITPQRAFEEIADQIRALGRYADPG